MGWEQSHAMQGTCTRSTAAATSARSTAAASATGPRARPGYFLLAKVGSPTAEPRRVGSRDASPWRVPGEPGRVQGGACAGS